MNVEQGRLAAHGVWEKVLYLLGEFSGLKILDAPAGKGIFSKKIQDRGGRPFCLDISHIPEQTLQRVRGDLNASLPFRSGQFDRVVCIEGIEHLENPSFLLREYYRVLKDGGILILTTPNTQNLRSRIKFLLTGNLFWFGGYAIKAFGHITPLFLPQLIHFSESAGFILVNISTNRNLFWIKPLSFPLKMLSSLIKERHNDSDILGAEILILELKKKG